MATVHLWSSHEDIHVWTHADRKVDLKDNENERLENQDDEGTEGERDTHTHTQKKAVTYADDDRACPAATPHPTNTTIFLQQRLSCLVFSLHASDLERERERVETPTNECWGGKRNQTRPTVLNCLTMLASTWYLLGCCAHSLGFNRPPAAVPDDPWTFSIDSANLYLCVCCFYFPKAAKETAGLGGAVVWPECLLTLIIQFKCF
jgi:hypothetical protein